MNRMLSGDRLQGSNVAMTDCTDRDVPMHSHTFFEFAYVVSGKAEHTINNRTFLLSAGDYFLINLNDAHSYREIAGTDGFRIINCLFLPRFIDGTLESVGSFHELLDNYFHDFGYRKGSERVTLRSYHDSDGFVGTLMEKMLGEYREKRPGFEEILRSCLVSLLVCLARNDTEGMEMDRITPFIKEYVAAHYSRPIGLSDVQKELNFSLTHLSVTFKRDTGMSFRDYLIKIRMERACRLLRLSEKTVGEISEAVGYSDPAFFYKSFQKALGQTPKEYRNREKFPR